MIEKVYQSFVEECELFFVKKFISSPTIKTEYSECLDIIFNVTGTMDSGRGIVAFNSRYGQGKSFFFDVVNHRHKRTKGRNKFKRITATELCEIYKNAPKNSDPETELKSVINVRNLFIDDIGDELKNGAITHHYNNKLNVIRYVILHRYKLWMEKGYILHGTTNLSIDDISKNYDGRVADRLLQMTYWKEFNFLAKGSFRQIKETRKLTPAEVEASWKKFEKQKEIVKVDMTKYLNELMVESDDYFDTRDGMWWNFIKNELVKRGILGKEDFDKIDEGMLEACELNVRRSVRETKRMSLKHAPSNVRSSEIDRALAQIKGRDVYDFAEAMIAKRKFTELRESKYIFKND